MGRCGKHTFSKGGGCEEAPLDGIHIMGLAGKEEENEERRCARSEEVRCRWKTR